MYEKVLILPGDRIKKKKKKKKKDRSISNFSLPGRMKYWSVEQLRFALPRLLTVRLIDVWKCSG